MSIVILDRRVQRTRQLLKDALIALITEKGFDLITIQELLDKANVGRSTFYLHYENKNDLLHAIFYDVQQDFSLYLESNKKSIAYQNEGRSKDVCFQSLVFIENNRSLFIALLINSGLSDFEGYLYTYLYQVIYSLLETKMPKITNKSLESISNYKTSGFIGIIKWWLKDKHPLPLKSLKRIINGFPFNDINIDGFD